MPFLAIRIRLMGALQSLVMPLAFASEGSICTGVRKPTYSSAERRNGKLCAQGSLSGMTMPE
jgi:hypothetical protein